MPKFMLIFLTLSLLIACNEKKETLSIESTTMKEILKDLHVADEMVQRFRTEEKDSVRKVYLMEIATIYHTDTSEIFQNLDVLERNPELAYEIYTSVYDELDMNYKELSDDGTPDTEDKIK